MGLQVMELRPVQCDRAALARYGDLFSACFSPQVKFSQKALRWLYADNPDGQVVGFDAFDGDKLAAHYACIPTKLLLNGVPEQGLLSLNTATHPRYQGQGLFTRLAGRTYEAAAAAGYGCVYGVANANSTPGFVRKLGFQLVAPLRAMVGIGRLGFDPLASMATAGFYRTWSPQALAWRCANPTSPVAMWQAANGARCFFASGPVRLVAAYAELPPGEAPASLASRPAMGRLYLGLAPPGRGALRGYVDIPRKLRPSPLNLIFKDLTGLQRQLDPAKVFFSFLDFDAY